MSTWLLGVIPRESRAKRSVNWWDLEDDDAAEAEESAPMVLGHQAELFDEAGQAVYLPVEPHAAPSAGAAVGAGASVAVAPASTVRTATEASSRVVVTRRLAAVPRVVAIPKAETAVRGEVARRLMMSKSISSGKEGSRWFSVPRRALLPRYQLFEGHSSVEETSGKLHVRGRGAPKQRGHVWFV